MIKHPCAQPLRWWNSLVKALPSSLLGEQCWVVFMLLKWRIQLRNSADELGAVTALFSSASALSVNHLGQTFVKVETNNLCLPFSPAEHPCRKHLPRGPVWVGHVREGELTREVCLEAVLRAWPGWGVCHNHCLQHPGTAELAPEDLCLQVLNCTSLSGSGGLCTSWAFASMHLQTADLIRKVLFELVLMACTRSVHLNNFLWLCLNTFSWWV